MTDTKPAKTEADTEQFVPVADDAHQPTTFKHVLVGVDGTSTGRDAIALAETLRHPDGRTTLPTSFPSRLRDTGIFTPHLPRKTHGHARARAGRRGRDR